MVILTRIYTRGGDKGKTSLGSGARVSKSDLRIAALGSVDEANSSIGICRVQGNRETEAILTRIQNDLFDVGADLCMPDLAQPALRIAATQVEWLEEQIDNLNEQLAPLNSFILPGGSPAAAYLHMARAIVRRAERDIVALNENFPLNLDIVKYINRLSDLLFVMARAANHNGLNDILWIPGDNR
ncbi:cob(I)yrinic acid a,c-diamide adenosyltransferase [Candidatus Paracaedibacter symbiosus]|uniref:cob(I)yrinic acid a,c-diamide adenosyltransferase n=1 Tax=Candidatus Paracaedibacter symbiosus TaxID=244582 RepID=UPI00050979BE|nr:cob(I)yrinic acid a,c-diamide adenosyltransferase [Candidatus Paracaedibacter symbiosus]